MNRAAFYKTVRTRLGPLTTSQVAGIEALLDVIAGQPLAYAAYMLATAWHETATTMLPIKEQGGDAYFTRMYDVAGDRTALCIANGNTCAGDGPKYCGRGYVQLTWKNNYKRASDEIGYDFVADPDRAMDITYAARIMLVGMLEGWFTGRKLSTYLPSEGVAIRQQYMAARRIINGTDAADLIEDYAQVFELALRDAGVM